MAVAVRDVFPRTAEFEGDRLVTIGGVGIRRLAAQHGTPLYVLDEAELVGRMRSYREAFGPDVRVVYAAKALCVTGVLQLAAAEGLSVDVASAGELHTALRAGVPGPRIVFHGNNKSVDELVYAAKCGVGRVVVDSFVELERLGEVGERLGHHFDVWLRVTPGVEAHTHAFIRTGHDDTKFGFTLSTGVAEEAVIRALGTPAITLRGLHCHIGSQILAPEAFDAAAQVMVVFLTRLRDEHAVTLEELNLGGGLGIAYVPEDEVPDLARYADALREGVRSACERAGLPMPRLAVEPGRSIAGPAGITLYTVGTVKDIPGVRVYASVDGGMSDNLRPALYGAPYTFVPAGDAPSRGPERTRAVTIAGKHCESGDVLAHDVLLPEALAPGDLVAVGATGAYTYAMANNYNRLPRPAMVLVGEGRSELLVRRESLDDVVGHDVPLDRPPAL